MTRLEVIAGVHREQCTAYRAVGHYGDHTEHIAMSDDSEAGLENLRRIAAAWQRGHKGARVEFVPEHFHRWVSGGDNETPANTGR